MPFDYDLDIYADAVMHIVEYRENRRLAIINRRCKDAARDIMAEERRNATRRIRDIFA